jgi:hypothetical protein
VERNARGADFGSFERVKKTGREVESRRRRSSSPERTRIHRLVPLAIDGSLGAVKVGRKRNFPLCFHHLLRRPIEPNDKGGAIAISALNYEGSAATKGENLTVAETTRRTNERAGAERPRIEKQKLHGAARLPPRSQTSRHDPRVVQDEKIARVQQARKIPKGPVA